MLWISALSFAYYWPDGKIGSGLADSASLLEWRYVISSTLFLKNEITESITFDNIKDWDPRVKRYLPEFIRKNDTKAKATNAVLDLGGIVPTAVGCIWVRPIERYEGCKWRRVMAVHVRVDIGDGVVRGLAKALLEPAQELPTNPDRKKAKPAEDARQNGASNSVPRQFSSGPSRRGCRACRRRRCR